MVESNSFMAMEARGFRHAPKFRGHAPEFGDSQILRDIGAPYVVKYSTGKRRREYIADARLHCRGQNTRTDHRFDRGNILRREIERHN